MSKISVSSPAAGTATYTISAPAGSTDRTITLPDASGTILTTATAGVPVNGPAFSAYASTTQSISSATDTKVLFGNEYFDTNSNFASSRFTPTIAGYYQLNTSVYIAPSANMILRLYKNGSVFTEFGRIGSTAQGMSGAVLVYANGSTDYFEIYVYSTAASPVLGNSTDPYFVQFSGALVRSAT